MLSKKFYTSISLPVLTLASACSTTQSRLEAYPQGGAQVATASSGDGTYTAGTWSSAPRQPYLLDKVTPASWLRKAPYDPAPVPPLGVPQSPVQVPPNAPLRPQILPELGLTLGLTPRAMTIGRMDGPPPGLTDLCIRMPQVCDDQANSARTQSGFVRINDRQSLAPSLPLASQAPAPITAVRWTPETRALINQVNRRINDAMIGTTDLIAFGRQELWTLPLSMPDRPRRQARPQGDCEDFALEKRRALIEAGVPKDALFLAVAVSERTGLHAVLVISTDQGDFVLDNMNDWLTEWSKTDYVWIKRQTSTSLKDWAMVFGPKPAPALPIPAPQRDNPFVLARMNANPQAMMVAQLPPQSYAQASVLAPVRIQLPQVALVRSQGADGASGDNGGRFRGFVSIVAPQYVAANSANAGAGFYRSVRVGETDPWAVRPLRVGGESPPRQMAEATALTPAPAISTAPAFAAPDAAPQSFAPKSSLRLQLSQNASDWPTGSAQAHLRIALAPRLQTIPKQPEYFVAVDGTLTSLKPQELPDFHLGALTFAFRS